MRSPNAMNRRDFLRVGLAGGALTFGPFASENSAQQRRRVSLVADPSDQLIASTPVKWALGELHEALESAGAAVRWVPRLENTAADDVCVIVCRASASRAQDTFRRSGVTAPSAPEGLALVPTVLAGRQSILAAGADTRGLVYALLELADRARHASAIDAVLGQAAPITEQPANPVRSVMRQFTSETLDTPWLFDRAMWPQYLGMLAAQRFNRLHLGFGLGYDTLRGVTDSYLLFLYPFLVAVPGYDVRVTNLSDTERGRHLETLRFISDQTVAHGLDFQLGIWMHGYELPSSPSARYVVQGLTPATHAAYCRDALTAVLRACPAISAVALRIHGESGIAEGSYEFWGTVFDGVKNAGRRVEIDLHAKGLDQTMIDRAMATGMPVAVSPKYWAEHLGMPYHQAAIRDLEMPVAGRVGAGLMTLSEGARVFTRYGYADLLRDDRKYTIRHRVFSGTQRLLLSGDPAWTASYAKAFAFCGSTGVDLMEPLTCRGRRGTGVAGSRRSGYVDAGLEPRWDWQKFEYWYRVWGRLTYNPTTTSDVWRRSFADGDAQALESALANASRILPIVTTAHLPSAACDAYWPEVYWNQPMAAVGKVNPYGDTPAPKTFQFVSPLDPQLFSSIAEYAGELWTGPRSGKYSPIEVAEWLETCAAAALHEMSRAAGRAQTTAEFRRLMIDVEIQAGLGRFFAAKFRAGVLFALFERSSDRRPLAEAVTQYRLARDSWSALSERAEGVYADDLSASDKISNRGQWKDRLQAIDDDIAQLADRLAKASESAEPRVPPSIAAALAHPRRDKPPCRHDAPRGFRAGEAVPISIAPAVGRSIASARLYYRHVNQAERFERAEMTPSDGTHRASIPAAYTDSPYPLQYYVELTDGSGAAWLYPGFDADLRNQPYIILRRL